MMLPLLERLKLPGVLIADGAMGTMLHERGLKPGECPEKVNLESTEVLEEIAGLYLKAGAEMIQTNTFGGSPLKLSSYGLESKMEEINARAVRAVRKVAGDGAYVSGSCGPCGKILEPYGETGPEEVYESFRRQLKVLIAEGVDVVVIETMTDLNEAKLAVKAAKSISLSIPVCATMTYDFTPRGFYTIMGATVPLAAKELAEAGADAVGSNCGNGILNMIKIAEEFAKCSALPIIIQSNAGIPTVRDSLTIFPDSPEFMAEKSKELKRIGVKIIGGCCGTTPEHISAMKKVLNSSS